MGHGCVVDRENLHGLLVGLDSPVDHLRQVSEVAHAEAAFGAEGEDRDGRAGALPNRQAEVDVAVAYDQCFGVAQFRIGQIAVGVVFPSHDAAFFFLIEDEFVFQREGQVGGVDFHLPFGEVGVAHQDGFVGIPSAQGVHTSTHSQCMSAVNAGRVGFEDQAALASPWGCFAVVMGQERLSEGRGVEILLFRQVLPAVFQTVGLGGIVGDVQDTRQAVPFVADGLSIAVDMVTVMDLFRFG